MMKVWNVFLLALTFFLTIFGTFLTRSGLIASVHSFARSDIGQYFVGRRIGKRALAPVVSPKKTVEGLVGGVLVALVREGLHGSPHGLVVTQAQAAQAQCGAGLRQRPPRGWRGFTHRAPRAP